MTQSNFYILSNKNKNDNLKNKNKGHKFYRNYPFSSHTNSMYIFKIKISDLEFTTMRIDWGNQTFYIGEYNVYLYDMRNYYYHGDNITDEYNWKIKYGSNCKIIKYLDYLLKDVEVKIQKFINYKII